jgi:RNA polymerase sigma factor (sigma-70 family)
MFASPEKRIHFARPPRRFAGSYFGLNESIPDNVEKRDPGIKSTREQSVREAGQRPPGTAKCEGDPLSEPSELRRFEQIMLPHLGAAYNLARWLTRDDHDAEDVVQESYLRALRFFESFRGGDGRTWFLTVVRNTCFTWIKGARARKLPTFDETTYSTRCEALDPGRLVLRRADGERIRAAVDGLPAEFREVIVLRELEGMSYKEIAATAGIPIGTVMSRLTRARQRLLEILSHDAGEEC